MPASDPIADRVQANAEAFRRLTSAQPVWVGVKPARLVVPGLDEQTLLHAGPPLDGPPPPLLQRALAGGLVFERRASNPADAVQLLDGLHLGSCNDRHAVAPLAGVVSPSMPMVVVQDSETGAEAYAPLNEGGGCVLRFGCTREQAISNLWDMAENIAPLLEQLLARGGGIELYPILSSALHMGDDLHHRFKAIQLLLAGTLSQRADALEFSTEHRRAIVNAVEQNDFFPLNLVMAASKAAASAAEGVHGSSLVTAIARNGRTTGIQVSGLPGRWFAAPVDRGTMVPFDAGSEVAGEPDTGDSCINEVNGLGACALAGAPTLARWFGGTTEALVALTDDMYRITVGEHPIFTIPSLGFRGTPTGFDCVKAVALAVAPITETLEVVLERHPHVAAVGLSRVPLAALRLAAAALDEDTAKD